MLGLVLYVTRHLSEASLDLYNNRITLSHNLIAHHIPVFTAHHGTSDLILLYCRLVSAQPLLT